MKYLFSWQQASNSYCPVCKPESKGEEDFSPLSCLLMDDGGIPYIETTQFVKQLIDKLDLILEKKSADISWDREAWGARCSKNGVTIYSLYDEEFSEIFSINDFRYLVSKWLEFIQTEPSLHLVKEIDLADK